MDSLSFVRTPGELYNIEAEMGLLGSMLLSGAIAQRAVIRARPDMFWRPAHRIIYQTMDQMIEEGVAIDFLTLKAALLSDDNLQNVGGEDYILQLAEFVPSPANWDHYLGIVEGFYRRRVIHDLGCQALADDFDLDHDTILGLLRPTSATNPVLIGDVEGGDKPRLVVPTGFAPIDNAAGGIGLGSTAVILAGSGAGKSAFCMHRAIHAAREGFPVLYLSLMDLDERALWRRAMQCLTGWSHRPDGGAPLVAWKQAEEDLRGLEIYLHAPYKDHGGNRLGNIMALIQQMVRKRRVKVVILDYVQRLQPEGRVSDYQFSYNAENELTLLANKLGIALWYASQGTESETGIKTKGGRHWNEGSECTVVVEPMTDAQITARQNRDSTFIARFAPHRPLSVRCEKMRHAPRFKGYEAFLNDRLELVEP